MPVLKYLADTNVISDAMRREAPVVEWLAAHPHEIAICSLSIAEIRLGIESKPDGKSRRDLERKFGFIMEAFEGCVWTFDEAAAFEWGRLIASARNRPIPFGDSLIAAITRSMGATVLTRNTRDFPACTCIDPWTGAETLPVWPA
jgi:predicted nucleic acid-binding protein